MKKEMEGGRKEKQKILPENSLGVSPRIKAVSRQQYAKKQNAIFLKFMLIKEKYLINPSPLHWHRVPQQSCHRE